LVASKIPALNQKNVALEVVKKLPEDRIGQISINNTKIIGISKIISEFIL